MCQLPSVLWHCWLGGRKGIRPVKNMRGWWRWALVSPDGVAPSQMVGVSASIYLPLHHKVQKFSSLTPAHLTNICIISKIMIVILLRVQRTDFKLSLDASFTSLTVVNLTAVVIVHNIHELTRQSRMLRRHTRAHTAYNKQRLWQCVQSTSADRKEGTGNTRWKVRIWQ